MGEIGTDLLYVELAKILKDNDGLLSKSTYNYALGLQHVELIGPPVSSINLPSDNRNRQQTAVVLHDRHETGVSDPRVLYSNAVSCGGTL